MLKYLDLLKTTDAYREIVRDFSGGSPAHAYLLLSRDRAAVAELAAVVAMCVHCGGGDKPCLSCRACRNTMARVHPDVKYLPERDARLGVEEISDMIADTTLSGIESENKVYVIAGAGDMLPVAQNKLLKTIEEPPAGVTIVLTAENEAGVLTTIKSRVRQIALQNFSVDTIERYLTDRYGDAERASVIAVCADGLLGRADEMYANEEYYNMYNDMFRVLENFTDSSKVLERTVMLARHKENVREMLNFLLLVLRDVLMSKTAPSLVRARHRQAELSAIAKDWPQAALVAALAKVDEAKRKLFYNCNLTAVFDELLFDILEERAKCRL